MVASIKREVGVGTNQKSKKETYVLYFTRRISIVTAVRFVIVDFKEMNEWMTRGKCNRLISTLLRHNKRYRGIV